MSQKVLFILTNAKQLDPSTPTGVWLEEYAVPLRKLRKKGVEVTVSSPKGGEVPVDPKSLEGFDVKTYADEVSLLKDSKPLSEVKYRDFDAIFFPGGHGPVLDLPQNPIVQDIVKTFDRDKKPIAALCHGVAALLEAHKSDGTPVIQGRRLTGFSNTEEEAVGLENVVPFLVESRVRECGGHYEKNQQNFEDMVIVDGHFITGQNPASSARVADKLMEKLGLH